MERFFRRRCRWGGLVAALLLCAQAAMAQSGVTREGIDQVRAENYEEAIPLLEKARQREPDSSLAAFFLGMAYKGAARFPEALPHLRDAVTLTPKIREAMVELIDLLLILSSPEAQTEAERWIEAAETAGLFPARVALLEGRLLKKQGRYAAAAEAFARAKAIDPELAQSCDYQIALCRLRAGEMEAARTAFARVVDRAPDSDLAAFARRYAEMVDDRLFAERPLRITLSLLGQYDTNMVLKPTDDAAATGITDEEGFTTTDILSLEYAPEIEGRFTFHGRYAALANLHQHVGDSHDIIGNTVTLLPGLALDGWSAGLKGRYTHYLRRNPDYAAYMDQLSLGPVIRWIPADDHFLELQAAYEGKNFFDPPALSEEDRDAEGGSGSLSWIWRAADGLFFNLGYQYVLEETDGANWENTGHRFLLSSQYAVTDDLTLRLGVEAFLQEYDNVHSIFGKAREDNTNAVSGGVTWDIHRHLSLLLHHTRTRSNSNLAIYDYTRNLTSLGVELRY